MAADPSGKAHEEIAYYMRRQMQAQTETAEHAKRMTQYLLWLVISMAILAGLSVTMLTIMLLTGR